MDDVHDRSNREMTYWQAWFHFWVKSFPGAIHTKDHLNPTFYYTERRRRLRVFIHCVVLIILAIALGTFLSPVTGVTGANAQSSCYSFQLGNSNPLSGPFLCAIGAPRTHYPASGPCHLHASEQIRIYLVPLPRRRRAVLRVDGPKAHKPHQANNAASGDTNASRPKLALYRAQSARGTLHVESVDLFHNGKVLLALASRGVVGRRTAQFDQFTLANHGQAMRAHYHGAALG